MTTDTNILDKIKTLPAMASVDDKDLEELLRISKISQFKAGERIVEESATDGWIYYLLSGKVRIVKNNVELAVLRRIGDIFGNVGTIMGDSLLPVSVDAMDETVCLKIAISNVDNLSDENRFVFRYIIFRGFAEVMAKRLRFTTEKYIAAKEEIARLKSLVKE